MKAAFWTLGCKLNQSESRALEEAFLAAGFTIADDAPLWVINTCTVTGKAEQKARRIVQLAKKAGAAAVVTGCAVKETRKKDGVVYVAQKDKARLAKLPAFLAGGACGDAAQSAAHNAALSAARIAEKVSAFFEQGVTEENPFAYDGVFKERAGNVEGYARPFLKIQDGCDNACAFCAVRLARGKSVFLEKDEVLSRLLAFERAGFAEVCLTGVNISLYPDFPKLLDFLIKNSYNVNIRLSSLPPNAVSGALLDVLPHPRVRPHLHLSVQSGSYAVLGRMGRLYTRDAVLYALSEFRKRRDNPFAACDIITGFPSESDADFEDTRLLCKEARFAWIHAFPFSPRKGTLAYAMKGRVPERVARERSAVLLAMAEEGERSYLESWKGREVEAVLEGETKDGRVNVTTANYIKTTIPLALAEGKRRGEAVRIVL